MNHRSIEKNNSGGHNCKYLGGSSTLGDLSLCFKKNDKNSLLPENAETRYLSLGDIPDGLGIQMQISTGTTKNKEFSIINCNFKL